MKCPLLIFALLLGLNESLCTVSNANELVYQYSSGIFHTYRNSEGFDEVSIKDCYYASLPGTPRLPYEVRSFVLPPGADYSSLKVDYTVIDAETLDNQYNIQAYPPFVISLLETSYFDWGRNASIYDGRDTSIYSFDAYYPYEAVRIIRSGSLHGVKYVDVGINAIQYNPRRKKLIHIKNVIFTIRYGLSENSSSEVDIRQAMALATNSEYENADDIIEWYGTNVQTTPGIALLKAATSASSDTSKYNYIIITSEAVKNNLQKLDDFKLHLNRMGYSVKIITEVDYDTLTGQEPNERADRIREWLIRNYSPSDLGIEYVLLLGNPDPYNLEDSSDSVGDVPMKMCWPRKFSSTNREVPTDAYYADLNGNWDLDGDLYYGTALDYNDNYLNLGVDFNAEVDVGRIPVFEDRYEEADSILMKIIDYDTEAGDLSWRKRMLLPTAILAHRYENGNTSIKKTDGRDLPEEMIDNILTPNSFDHFVFYEKDGIDRVPDTAAYDNSAHLGLTMDNFISEWNQGYGCVFWTAHGAPTYITRNVWWVDYNGDSIPQYNSGEYGYKWLFDNTRVGLLNNYMPSIVYSSSCQISYPEVQDNLANALMEQGCIGVVGASRYAWGHTGTWSIEDVRDPDHPSIGYNFFNYIISKNKTLSGALNITKNEMPTHDIDFNSNLYGFNLIGAPHIRLKREYGFSVLEAWSIESESTDFVVIPIYIIGGLAVDSVDITIGSSTSADTNDYLILNNPVLFDITSNVSYCTVLVNDDRIKEDEEVIQLSIEPAISEPRYTPSYLLRIDDDDQYYFIQSTLADTVRAGYDYLYVLHTGPLSDSATVTFSSIPGWLEQYGDSLVGVPDGPEDSCEIDIIVSDGGKVDEAALKIVVVPPPQFHVHELWDTVYAGMDYRHILAVENYYEGCILSIVDSVPGLSITDDTLLYRSYQSDTGESIAKVLLTDGVISDTMIITLSVRRNTAPLFSEDMVVDTITAGEVYTYWLHAHDVDSLFYYCTGDSDRIAIHDDTLVLNSSSADTGEWEFGAVADDGQLTDTLIFNIAVIANSNIEQPVLWYNGNVEFSLKNPARNGIVINSTLSEECKIVIMDLKSNVLHSDIWDFRSGAYEYKTQTSLFNAGVFILVIKTKSDIYRMKIIEVY